MILFADRHNILPRLGTVLAVTLLLGCAATAACARDRNGVDPKSAWLALLHKPEYRARDYPELQKFMDSDPEQIYTTLAGEWRRIPNVAVRQILIDFLIYGSGKQGQEGVAIGLDYKPNPHLADLLALALEDPAPNVRENASRWLAAIAFQPIRTPQEYREWRKTIGSRPACEVIDGTCRGILRSLETARGLSKIPLLRRLLAAPFYLGAYTSPSDGRVKSGIRLEGLTAFRRSVGEAAGLVDAAGRCLRSANPPEVRALAIKLLASFGLWDRDTDPLEPDLQREIPRVLDDLDGEEMFALLARFRGKWVTDLLIRRMEQGDSHRFNWSWAVSYLGNSGDPRGIPCLIAMRDIPTPSDYLAQAVEQSLARLTGTRYIFNAEHDGDWWRGWWREHKNEFPSEARATPLPNFLGKSSSTFTIRRHAERRVVGGSPRSYWLISSGLTPPSEAGVPIGLVVVFSEHAYSADQMRYWQQITGDAWQGRYLVALIPLPGDTSDSSAWPLRKTADAVTMTAQEMASEVVRDAQNRVEIDPRRVYLCGEGDAGMAVYACALEKSTPFQGFLLLSAPFRSARLPNLALAKGRRFYLLHSKSDRTTPYFLAAAAEKLLRNASAAITLMPYDGDPAYHSSSGLEPLRQAMRWLETSERNRANRRE